MSDTQAPSQGQRQAALDAALAALRENRSEGDLRLYLDVIPGIRP